MTQNIKTFSLQRRLIFFLDILPFVVMGFAAYAHYQRETHHEARLEIQSVQNKAEKLATVIAPHIIHRDLVVIEAIVKTAGINNNFKIVTISDDGDSVLYKLSASDVILEDIQDIQIPIYENSPINTSVIGTLRVGFDKTKNEKTQLVYAKELFFLILCLASLQVLFTRMVLGYFLNPMNRMTRKLKDIAANNTAIQIPYTDRHDEIGEMARALQTLRDHAVNADQLQMEHTREEAHNDAKSKFLANISHEIRTPLNGILGIVELLSVTSLTGQQTKLLKSLELSGRVLLALVNDILDVSKIESGKFQIFPAVANIHDAFQAVIDMYKPLAQNKMLAFDVTCAPEVPAFAYLDVNRLQQIMSNLVSNAIKYTDKGRIQVTLAVTGPSHSPQLQFRVSDTGRGIPDDMKGKIFKRFSQLHGHVVTGGTGLGLEISQALIDLMGGHIGFESVVDSGSVFTLTLPLQAVAEDEAQQIYQLEALEHVQGTCRALLAEDIETNQFVITQMLENLGCTVDIAVNGKVALDMQGKNAYDIIFMDCNMPVMDGYTATETLRARGDKVFITAITAFAMPEEQQKCLDIGMNMVVTKPVSRKALSEALSRWFLQSVVKRPNVPIIELPTEDETEVQAYDDSFLRGMLARDKDKGQKLIMLTKRDSEDLFDTLMQAMAQDNHAEIAQAAHALKSVVSQAGALSLAEIYRDLEIRAKNEIAFEDYQVEHLKAAHLNFLEFLDNLTA